MGLIDDRHIQHTTLEMESFQVVQSICHAHKVRQGDLLVLNCFWENLLDKGRLSTTFYKNHKTNLSEQSCTPIKKAYLKLSRTYCFCKKTPSQTFDFVLNTTLSLSIYLSIYLSVYLSIYLSIATECWLISLQNDQLNLD